MIIELFYYITSIIVGIAIMVRFGIFSKLMAEFLTKKIQDKMSSLKVSAPNLTYTFDGSSSLSK